MPTLNWIGKEKVINHHRDVPYRVLEHKYGFSDCQQTQSESTASGNLIINGDNLEALKALLPKYEGKVDCIYIDPPYNTGNEGWVYNDNVNDPKILKWLGDVVGKEGEDLSRHDKWLCMMYPRLQLLNRLLSFDGCMVISIGFHELSNLLLVCKEIFGTKQIVPITIQTSGGKPSSGFNYLHEYLVFIVPLDFKSNPMISFGGNTRSPFEGLTLATFTKVQRPNQAYPIFVDKITGMFHSTGLTLQEKVKNKSFEEALDLYSYNYDEAPEGCVAIWPFTSKNDECVWRLIPKRLKEDWEKGYIKISKNNNSSIQNEFSIQYLPSGIIKKIEEGSLTVTGTENDSPTLRFGDNQTVGGQVPTIWMNKSFYTVKGTNLIQDIFEKKAFNYPKSLDLIYELIGSISTKESVILDSFAGSGTTAHAVLNLNKEDGGNRKFILVEMEDYADTITAERVKRVINGYGEGNNATGGTGGSFDYFTLGQPLFVGNGQEFLNEDIPESKMREYIWYSETRSTYLEIDNSADAQGFLGQHQNTAYYFVYQKNELITLDLPYLASIKTKAEQYVIYADNCLLSKDFMAKHNIIFKKSQET